jgi:UPF0755 protein
MNSHNLVKKILYGILIVFIIAGIKGIDISRKAFSPNVFTRNKKVQYLFIPTGSGYDDVLKLLYTEKLIKNKSTFEWAAERMNYKKHIQPGKYKLKNRMTNHKLILMLRSGQQEPIKLTFNNIRTLEQLAGIVSRKIEADYSAIINLLHNKEYINQIGFNEYTIIGLFIPNTYEFYWNTSALQFISRMLNEYNSFWTRARKSKAEQMNLTQNEVITLASIVDEESSKEEEDPIIAGVYINRLKKGIKLQADPTVRYAHGDFSMRRILTKHLSIESPYNTYKYYGLPPGPIRIPSIKSIDAVLNYKKHDYLYFCAKDDFSGYHYFAKTLAQHNKYARLYQRALNKRRILN